MAKIRQPKKVDHNHAAKRNLINNNNNNHNIDNMNTNNNNNNATTPTSNVKLSSRIANSNSSSYSTGSDSSSDDGSSCSSAKEQVLDNDLDNIISDVKNLNLFGSAKIRNDQVHDDDDDSDSDESDDEVVNNKKKLNFIYLQNIASSEDEKSSSSSFGKLSDEDYKDSDEDDKDDELIERGPVRPQMHSVNRSKPYVESAHHWPTFAAQPSENSTDYDTSAKAILTDHEFREKIDMCLEQLSDMSQERSVVESLSPTHSDFGGASVYSPPQQQTWQQPDLSPSGSSRSGRSSCFVPSITVCDSESRLLEILSRGGFQAAAVATAEVAPQTPDYNSTGSVASSSLACVSDNWPDSPASCYNACANSMSSRPNSRASSRAQSPGSINGACSVASTSNSAGANAGGTFLNVLSSPLGSPQLELLQSPQQQQPQQQGSFRSLQRPSSSSSSSQSYCETPSPANYQSPLDHHLEERLGDQMMTTTRLPVWRDSFESSDTLVNSVDSSELQLQLVEEIIRGDMKVEQSLTSKVGGGHRPPSSDMQVVPNCHINSPPSNYDSNHVSPASYHTASVEVPVNMGSVSSTSDDLTNTLLRFVGGGGGGEQVLPQPTHRKVEARCSSGNTFHHGGSNLSPTGEDDCLRMANSTTMAKKNYYARIEPEQQTTYQQQQQQQCIDPINIDATDMMGSKTWQSYTHQSSSSSSSSTAVMKNLPYAADFQIPETVTSYNSHHASLKSSSSSSTTTENSHRMGRSIAPWPSLNLPATRACERLKEVTDPRDVEKAMKSLLKKPLKQLAKADDDGDTMLMCLVGNPLELSRKLAFVAPLVERLSTIEGSLSVLNNRGEDALYLAAMNCPRMAFVVGYLAAACLQKSIDISQRLYRSRGDSLLHAVATKGDSYGEVLAELLSLKTAQGNLVFDLSKRNYDGKTALHVASEAPADALGRDTKVATVGIVRLLLANGADPTIREVRCGDTALHLAVSWSGEPSLVKVLLSGRGREAVNITNYNGNTPLHMAAAMSERFSLERQSEICWHLIHAGAKTNLTNRQGKTPLALVSTERKDAIRRIFYKKT